MALSASRRLRVALSAMAIVSGAPTAHAQGPTWPRRFERERPTVIRAIEGVPGPPGYELENHYDRRRLLIAGAALGLAAGLQVLTVARQGIEAPELVPCVGMFLGDYGERDADAGWVDMDSAVRAFVAVPVCASWIIGGIELGRGLADARPVWVRSQARTQSLIVGAGATEKGFQIHAVGRF